MSEDNTTEVAQAVSRSVEAYNALLPVIQAVPADKLVHINIDVPIAITTTLGSLPEIMAMQPAVEASLPDFDSSLFESLKPRTLALAHTHAAHLLVTRPPGELKAQVEAATKSREVLLAGVNALIARGLVDPSVLDNLKGPVGYRNVAFDVLALTALLRKSWPTISSKTAITLDELDRAGALAEQVLTAQGLKDQAPAASKETAELRQRAFTLFIKTYDQVRRAIHYLRWEEGDAEEIAPSLYAGRRRRSTTTTEAPVSTPTSDVAQANTDAGASVASPVPNAEVALPAAGLPGSNPFTN